MGNNTDTKSTWTLGVQSGGITGLPLFTWGNGDLNGVKGPVSFSSETGHFLLRLPRQDHFGTADVKEFIDRLTKSGLSEPPELRKVQEVYVRFAEDLSVARGEEERDIYAHIETEWRKLLSAPSK